MKVRFKNLYLVCIYVPTKVAEEDDKDVFNESLEELMNKLPNYDLCQNGGCECKHLKRALRTTFMALSIRKGKASTVNTTNENRRRLLSHRCQLLGACRA